VMGQGVVWYTGQFYAQSFIENTCKIEFNTSRYIILWAIVFATPFFIYFGYLSDRIGRKWIIMTGLVLAVCTYRPIYKHIYESSVIPQNDVIIVNNMSTTRSLASSGDSVITYTANITSSSGWSATSAQNDTIFAKSDLVSHRSNPVFSNKKPPSSVFNILVLLVFIQILYVTMVYGPIAAFLVELFPTRIRYTSMSLPYHIGNGVFGGLVPFLATLIASFPGSDYRSGLWYPIIVATVCAIIGTLYLKNKIDQRIDD
ncbi:MAG: MFS transporter, partial [Saprospiraceae bacterium]